MFAVRCSLYWSARFCFPRVPRARPPRDHSSLSQPAAASSRPCSIAPFRSPAGSAGTDGKAHLVYELLLTNAIPAPVTLSALEVRDADSGATLIRLAGDSLLAATSLATSPDTPAVASAAGIGRRRVA